MKTIERFSRSTLLLALVLAAVTTVAVAEDRQWMKRHYVVKDLGDAQIAEFVMISTRDDVQPTQMRFLYAGDSGQPLVIRSTVDTETMNMGFSVTMRETAERLTFELMPSLQPDEGLLITMDLDGAAVTFLEDNRMSPRIRKRAGEILAGASDSFQGALRSLTLVGENHGGYLHAFSKTLHELFFFDDEVSPEPIGGERMVDATREFNPNRQAPTRFELRFREAYYD